MEMNPFYITPETIWDRLSRVHQDKVINYADVVEWAAECTTEYIEDFDSFMLYSDIELPVEANGKIYLPCLVYRILNIHDGKNRRINYNKYGGYIRITESDVEKVYIDYIGIPVDDSGNLLIDKNQAQAVEAFIVHKLYYSDYLTQRLHPNMWQEIKLTMENELIAARSSFRHWDQSRLETMEAIKADMCPEIAKVPFYKLMNTAQYSK